MDYKDSTVTPERVFENDLKFFGKVVTSSPCTVEYRKRRFPLPAH